MKISRNIARRFALQKQSFCFSQDFVTKKQILSILERLGCVQIDTINVVERSHYLVFWSRLGNYKKEYLDQLLYPDRKAFEYWGHAASIIPMEHYRYFLPAMKERHKVMRAKAKRWLKEDAGLLDTVLHEIKRNGPMSSKDFKYEEKEEKRRKSGWSSWKPTKLALELLYDAGMLLVSHREKFRRYYDLTENVLPSHVDVSKPAEEERQRFFVEKTLDAWGLAQPKDIGQYFYTWSTQTSLGVKAISELVRELEDKDIITKVQVERIDKPYLMLTKNLKSLEKMANAQGKESTVSLISPFDNLTWSKPRIKKLFDYHPTLEIYLSKETREFGYYALTILYDNQIVGRLDPKMRRDKSTLEIKALELKKGFKPTDEFKQKLAFALKDFMKFHNAQTAKISKSCPRFLKDLACDIC